MKPVFHLVLVAVAGIAAGCATPDRRVVEADRIEERTSTAKVNLHLDPDVGHLELGRAAASEGNFTTALEEFGTVYRHTSGEPELRAQALYQTALVQSNALNARRDLAAAEATARKLIEEFPKSEWRDDAEKLLATLERSAAP